MENMTELLKVNVTEWKNELNTIKEHYKKFGSKIPKALLDELASLESVFPKLDIL